MAKLTKDQVAEMQAMVGRWMNNPAVWLDNKPKGPEVVTLGVDAWRIGHSSGAIRYAFDLGPDIHDSHIKTALKSIFPNARFK